MGCSRGNGICLHAQSCSPQAGRGLAAVCGSEGWPGTEQGRRLQRLQPARQCQPWVMDGSARGGRSRLATLMRKSSSGCRVCRANCKRREQPGHSPSLFSSPEWHDDSRARTGSKLWMHPWQDLCQLWWKGFISLGPGSRASRRGTRTSQGTSGMSAASGHGVS